MADARYPEDFPKSRRIADVTNLEARARLAHRRPALAVGALDEEELRLKADGRPLRWLYLDTYTSLDPKAAAPSSDAIGYGLTSSPAIQRELRKRNIELIVPLVDNTRLPVRGGYQRARWAVDNYAQATEAIHRYRPDLIFVFHIFVVFPTVVRKVLQDLGLSTPIIGYTHGSHWDKTDSYRFERHPGLELLDAANMHVLDRLLVVSEYMRLTLGQNIRALNDELARNVLAKTSVVGLPIDTEAIDRYRTAERFDRVTIVFNHAPVSSKGPKLFARVAHSILQQYDVNFLITRKFGQGDPAAEDITSLAQRFKERVILGNDMSLADYYKALWMSDIQISTATHESLGVATLEAMYTNNCCVLPRIGSYPEICEQDPRALYELGEAQLGERLAYLIEHDSDRQEIGQHLSRLASKYEARHVVDRIIESIAEL